MDITQRMSWEMEHLPSYIKDPSHKVAIKIMLKDQNIIKSKSLVSKEITVLKDLNHDNIVRLYDHNISTSGVYLVMEYCNCGDLAEYLQKKTTLPEETIRHFAFQIGSAMETMFHQGVMHRDMKPGNILLSYRGEFRNVLDIPGDKLFFKLADFGFARFLQDGMMAATMCGSPMYMAPEVLMSDKYDAKADIWSMGIIIYQCLTGKAPFIANTPDQLKNIYVKTPILRPKIPATCSSDLADLIIKMLVRKSPQRIDYKSFLQHPFLIKRKSSNFISNNSIVSRMDSASRISALVSGTGLNRPVNKKNETYRVNLDSRMPPLRVNYSRDLSSTSNSRANLSAPRQNLLEDRRSQNGLYNEQGLPNIRDFLHDDSEFSHSLEAPPGVNDSSDDYFFDEDLVDDNSHYQAYNKLNRSSAIKRDVPLNAESSRIPPKVNYRHNRDEYVIVHSDGSETFGTTNGEFMGDETLSSDQYYESNTHYERPGVITGKGSWDQTRLKLIDNKIMMQKNNLNRLKAPNLRMPHLASEDSIPSSLEPSSLRGSLHQAPIDRTNQQNCDKEQSRVLPQATVFEVNANLTYPGPIHTFPAAEYVSMAGEYPDELFMDNEHVEELKKITMVLELCELLGEMAERKASVWADCTAVNGLIQIGPKTKSSEEQDSEANSLSPCLKFTSEAQRIVEQIVLYRRILYYLHYAFDQVTKAWEKGRIKPTDEMQRRLKECNSLYHRSYIQLRHLTRQSQREDLIEAVGGLLASVTANKLIFRYAMDQCVAAEIDECVGDIKLSLQRYKVAIILMHCLNQHAKTESDKSVLTDSMRTIRNRHAELGREDERKTAEQEQIFLQHQQQGLQLMKANSCLQQKPTEHLWTLDRAKTTDLNNIPQGITPVIP